MNTRMMRERTMEAESTLTSAEMKRGGAKVDSMLMRVDLKVDYREVRDLRMNR